MALASATGNLKKTPILWSPGATVCVVLASGGYPGYYETGETICGLEKINNPNIVVFHAGTKKVKGEIKTSSGRVLCPTAIAPDLKAARKLVYSIIGAPDNYENENVIYFNNMHHRTDIAKGIAF
ncbi:MAG: hypothetical protein M1268_01370 [Patescibacteria group bacterium]|nr:hypothetical protein [Patescibacteria group bacterium]